MLIAVLGLVAIGTGVGDAVYSHFVFCTTSATTTCNGNPVTFSQISAGAWGGAAVSVFVILFDCILFRLRLYAIITHNTIQ